MRVGGSVSKRNGQYLLFPGYSLDAPISSRYAANSVIGQTFELMTEALLGVNRLLVDSNADLCPDGQDTERCILAESKASCRHNKFKVSLNQLDRYWSVMREWVALGKRYRTLYALWTYDVDKIVSRSRTKRDMVAALLNSVTNVEVLCISVLRSLRERIEAGRPCHSCQVKTYRTWTDTLGKSFYAMQISQVFLRELRLDPDRVMCDITDNSPEYAITKKTLEAVVEMDGVVFSSRQFDCLEVRPVDGKVFFPEIELDLEIPI